MTGSAHGIGGASRPVSFIEEDPGAASARIHPRRASSTLAHPSSITNQRPGTREVSNIVRPRTTHITQLTNLTLGRSSKDDIENSAPFEVSPPLMNIGPNTGSKNSLACAVQPDSGGSPDDPHNYLSLRSESHPLLNLPGGVYEKIIEHLPPIDQFNLASVAPKAPFDGRKSVRLAQQAQQLDKYPKSERFQAFERIKNEAQALDHFMPYRGQPFLELISQLKSLPEEQRLSAVHQVLEGSKELRSGIQTSISQKIASFVDGQPFEQWPAYLAQIALGSKDPQSIFPLEALITQIYLNRDKSRITLDKIHLLYDATMALPDPKRRGSLKNLADNILYCKEISSNEQMRLFTEIVQSLHAGQPAPNWPTRH